MLSTGRFHTRLVAGALLGCLTVILPMAQSATAAESDMDVFSLQVGTCFNDTNDNSDQVTEIPVVPCSVPHDNEVYAKFDTSLTSYPGEEEMFESAHADCLARFEDFVGLDYPDSRLDIYTLYPTVRSWKVMRDREVICALYDLDGILLEGSMRGSGI